MTNIIKHKFADNKLKRNQIFKTLIEVFKVLFESSNLFNHIAKNCCYSSVKIASSFVVLQISS